MTDMADVLARLDRLQAQAYALSHGENAAALCPVAAPVLGAGGMPIAGVRLTIRGGQLPAAAFAILQGPHAQQVAQEFVRPVQLSQDTIGLRR